MQHNHSKLSFAIDMKQPGARELVMSMLPKIDVVVENFAPGVIKRLGFSYEDVKKVNPKIIMCSISMAGQTGPLSDKAGYDYIGQAYAGITDGIGEPDRAPAVITMAIGDVSTGVAAAMAVGFALLHRERTGEGQYLDASLLDTYFHMHEIERADGRVARRQSTAHAQRLAASAAAVRPASFTTATANTSILTIPTPINGPQFVRAMGMPELATDPRFKGARGRRDNNAELQEIIEEWLASISDARRGDRRDG